MKKLSVTNVTRSFSAIIDAVERDQEEIVLVRNNRQVARLVPDAPRQDAISVFGDVYRTLDDGTADALATAIETRRKNRRGRVSELRDPTRFAVAHVKQEGLRRRPGAADGDLEIAPMIGYRRIDAQVDGQPTCQRLLYCA